MYIRFNNTLPGSGSKVNCIRILLLILILLTPSLTGFGQTYSVSIFVTVTPPYTSRINDYVSQPNKIIVTVTSPIDQLVYFAGKITEIENGEEVPGGIMVSTNPLNKVLVSLRKGTFRIKIDDIPIFDANNLVYQGISKNDLLYRGGLPEGDYRICLQAFDINDPTKPISEDSPQGCSNIFSVRNLEPPVILQPACGSELRAAIPQFINFIWTRPPGAPFTTKYNLKIIEILPNSRNVNDAIQSAGYPVFFEKTVDFNFYQYSPADPTMVAGKRYAYIVTAIDPVTQTRFRNYGMSEACSFTLGTTELPRYTFTGKITWTFNENDIQPQSRFPLQFAQIELQLLCLSDSASKSFGPIRIGTVTTDKNGYFKIVYQGELREDYQAKIFIKNPYFSIQDIITGKNRISINPSSLGNPNSFDMGEFKAKANCYQFKPIIKDSTGKVLDPIRVYILRPSGFFEKKNQLSNLVHEVDVPDSTSLDIAFGSIVPLSAPGEKGKTKCNQTSMFLTNPIIIREEKSNTILSNLFFNQTCDDRYIILFWFNRYENYSFYLDIKEPSSEVPESDIPMIEQSFIVPDKL